jgi:hypothetical protein
MGATRKGGSISLCLSFLSFLFASCASDDVPQQTAQQPVTVDFALTVAKFASQGTSGTTRMVSAYTEGTNSDVRLQCAVPFTVTDATVSEPVGVSNTHTSSPIGYFDQPRSDYAYFTSSCDFNQGTNAILAYATPKTTSSSFWEKGALDATFNDYQPANISFRLKTIQTTESYLGTEEVKTIPEQLTDYLTAIANTSIGTGDATKTWKAYATSETMNNDLKLLFKNFTNQLSDDVGEVLPGSSANIKVWVTELWTQLNSLTSLTGDDASIRDAIKTNIEVKLDTETTPKDWKSDVKTAWDDFPASFHLPDGAAVVRWDGEKFVPETQTTTIADINNLDRLTYPAEIYYYGNSATGVSSEKLSDNFSTKDNWNDVLSGFTQGPVASNTKTVAMFDPLEYGVAQMKVQLQQTASYTLQDSQNNDVTVGSDIFKLTGIIVGGQLPVGFDFRPETIYPLYSEADMRFIYDSDVNTNGSTDAPFYLSTSTNENYIQTLVLQSYTGRSLKLVLEFENNSQDFKGNNGTVYKGTKFYLVGEVVPEIVDNPNVYQNRVFTQDHITTVKVTVTSLAKAYNVLPNLMSPRLEMGLELTPKWVQATTTDVIL